MGDEKEITAEELVEQVKAEIFAGVGDVVVSAMKAEKEAVEKESELLEQAAKAKKYDELLKENEKEETWSEAKKGVHIKKETKRGFSDEPIVMFDQYMRGRVGLSVAKKALEIGEVTYDPKDPMGSVRAKALTEGSATAGGVLVPSDWHTPMIELRDQASFPRKMGVQQITTTRDNIDLPTEATSFTKFARTAEAGDYGTNDPVLAANNVIPQKWTKLTKISEELVADDAYDLLGFLQRGYARAMAATENYYCSIGTGSNQHLGIMEGGDTDALTFDSADNITADEIPELFFKLGSGYRGQAAWLMASTTWAYLLGIRDANNWAFSAGDVRSTALYGSGQPDGTLLGKPVFLEDNAPTIATAQCPIMVGDPFYYALVDRSGLSIARLDELYKATGEVGFAANFRQSGTVLYEKAFVGGLMA